MAKTDERVDWGKAAATDRQPPRAPAAGDLQQVPNWQAGPADGWLMLAALAPAAGLGVVLSLWMCRSPLVNVAGCVTTFVLSLLGCVLGALIWLVSGSASVFHYCGETLPWGHPGFWRGLAGVVSISLVAWPMIGWAATARPHSLEATKRLICAMLFASGIFFITGCIALLERQRGWWALGLSLVSGGVFIATAFIFSEEDTDGSGEP